MSGLTRDKWFISDTHFFHANILNFKDSTGKLIRNFSDALEMNERMVEHWNARVKPQDKVYHLGDVACGVKEQSAFTELMYRLNGHKRLYLGNHDRLGSPAYKTFEKIELWSGGKFKPFGFVCSHIPLRIDQIRDSEFNIHGHIHQNLMSEKNYINVCVEHTDYKPLHLDEILQIIRSR